MTQARFTSISYLMIIFAFLLLAFTPPSFGGQTKVLGNGTSSDDNFGSSVDVSGDTIVIGAFGGLHDIDAPTLSGNAAYIFDKIAEDWQQVKKIKFSQDIFFAFSVAIDGDVVVIGAPFDGSDGAAYVYERNIGGPNNWGLARKLLPVDTTPGFFDFFGGAVAVNRDTIVVGAETDGAAKDQGGSAYVFNRSGNWQLNKKILPVGASVGQHFGSSVAVDGDIIAIGSSKNQQPSFDTYLQRSGSWRYNNRRLLDFEYAHSGDRWLAIDGETIVARGNNKLAIYVKNKNGSNAFGLEKQFSQYGFQDGDISGDIIVSDGPSGFEGTSGFGSVVSYKKNENNKEWEYLKHIKNPVPSFDDYGGAVAIDGNTVVIGAPGVDTKGESAGAAYVLNLSLRSPNIFPILKILLLED